MVQCTGKLYETYMYMYITPHNVVTEYILCKTHDILDLLHRPSLLHIIVHILKSGKAWNEISHEG